MISIFSHLFRPFGYLFIKGISGKCAYDFYAPAGLAVISFFIFIYLNTHIRPTKRWRLY